MSRATIPPRTRGNQFHRSTRQRVLRLSLSRPALCRYPAPLRRRLSESPQSRPRFRGCCRVVREAIDNYPAPVPLRCVSVAPDVHSVRSGWYADPGGVSRARQDPIAPEPKNFAIAPRRWQRENGPSRLSTAKRELPLAFLSTAG